VSSLDAGTAPTCGVEVAIRTLGCKVNRVESEQMVADLLGRGAVIADENAAAVVVVNTCTVTGEADAKARKAVRQALKSPRNPVVVVTGCLAAVDRAALEALGERVIVEPAKERVSSRVADVLGLAHGPHEHAVRTGGDFRTRAALKIEDGCDNFCTYCIVPYARGVPRSVELAQIKAEAAELVEAGVREIVLTGINIGRYRDASGATLADVVTAVAATGVSRLRLSSVEPPDLDQRLLSALAETPAVCPHLHMPLQSGSDEVLRAMNRKYTAARYERLILDARAALPGLVVTTDVIAAFPGETDAHAAETIALVERLGFAKLHVFRYSERPGTPAAAMAHVPARVRNARASELRALGERLRERYIASRQGGRASVLVESVDSAAGVATGTTEDYLKVELPATGVSEGDLIEVVLGGDVRVSG
jgi:threonylcarbamoyladenosine tRNA methylthiotransferase MtaB